MEEECSDGDNASATANNLTEISDEEEFFLLEDGKSSFMLGGLLFPLYLLIVLVNYGLIHYENTVPDTYRTLINKMVALIAWYRISLATVSMPPLAIKLCFKIKSLGSFPCWIIQFGIITCGMQIIMAHNHIFILKYIYTCRLSTMGSINEGLVQRFIIILNILMSILITTKLMLAFGPSYIVYQFCKGEGNICNLTELLEEM